MDTDLPWFWMSFVDHARPAGHGFIGGVMLRAPCLHMAVMLSHRMGCHPGGHMAAWMFPPAMALELPETFVGRLLNRIEAEHVVEMLTAACDRWPELVGDEEDEPDEPDELPLDLPATLH